MNNYLIAVDLEGVNGVVGQPGKTLSEDAAEYDRAIRAATKEINAAAEALYAFGADRVIVWDNHGTGVNLDFSLIDGRCERADAPCGSILRMSFAENAEIKGMLCLGYHAMAGTKDGVLAHTYNSRTIEYYKLNGKEAGEVEIDAYIAAELNIPVIFVASDSACIRQVNRSLPGCVTVITKYSTGRNSAQLRPENDVLQDIRQGVARAAAAQINPMRLTFPCNLTVRFTTPEFANKTLDRLAKQSNPPVTLKKDAHTLFSKLKTVNELKNFL